jgi:hypothetical protein
MSPTLPRWSLWTLAALFLGGCCFTVREEVDQTVCRIAEQPLDLLPPADTRTPASPANAAPTSFNPAAPPAAAGIIPAGAQVPGPAEPPRRRPPAVTIESRLQIPPSLPGSNVPPLEFVSPRATP